MTAQPGDLFVVKQGRNNLTMYRDVVPFSKNNTTLNSGDVLMMLGFGLNLNTIFLSKNGIVGWNIFRSEELFKYFDAL